MFENNNFQALNKRQLLTRDRKRWKLNRLWQSYGVEKAEISVKGDQWR